MVHAQLAFQRNVFSYKKLSCLNVNINNNKIAVTSAAHFTQLFFIQKPMYLLISSLLFFFRGAPPPR